MRAREKAGHPTKQSSKHVRRNKTTRSPEVDETVSGRQAAGHQEAGPDAVEESRIRVLRMLKRIDRVHVKIDKAFDGQAFLPNLAPDAPANRRRFNAYFRSHRDIFKLVSRGIQLYLILCGTTGNTTACLWPLKG